MFVENMLVSLLRYSNPIYFIVIQEAIRYFSELYLKYIIGVLLGEIIKLNRLEGSYGMIFAVRPSAIFLYK